MESVVCNESRQRFNWISLRSSIFYGPSKLPRSWFIGENLIEVWASSSWVANHFKSLIKSKVD